MGILSSKTLENMLEESEATAGKISSPEHVKTLSLDPRSPSDEIARTPILVEQTPSSDKPREFNVEDSFECASIKPVRTPLSSANSRANKKASLTQRIANKFSHPHPIGKELTELERHDENDAPVQLLHFELSSGDLSDPLEMNNPPPTGKMHRV